MVVELLLSCGRARPSCRGRRPERDGPRPFPSRSPKTPKPRRGRADDVNRCSRNTDGTEEAGKVKGKTFSFPRHHPDMFARPMGLSRATVPASPHPCALSSSPRILLVRLPSFDAFSKGQRYPGRRISVKRNRHQPFVAAAATEDNPTLTCETNVEQPSIFKTPESVDSPTKPSTSQEEEKERHDVSGVYDSKMIRVCDKLIDVFMVDKPTPTDWRRLLTFSKEWSSIRPHFFRRCRERADKEENPDMSAKLLRLGRKLKEVDEDVQRHNELLEVVRKAPSVINEVVSRRRKDFTKEFFLHVHTVAESYYDSPADQNEIAKLGNTCLAAVQAYDTATESIEALNAAEVKFQDIISSPSLDAACKKIDNLAAKNELDSALVLMITKAWSAAKESNMMKDEVKDILYHMYVSARGNLQRLMPKEIRILKYLLTLEDPMERDAALNDAFTPGEELEGKDVDSLYTTPDKLHTWIRTVIDAYNFSREGTLIREARDLMNPKIIVKLEELKKVVEDRYM